MSEHIFLATQDVLDRYENQEHRPMELGKWYFWDETESLSESFDSYEAAVAGLEEYVQTNLLGEPQ